VEITLTGKRGGKISRRKSKMEGGTLLMPWRVNASPKLGCISCRSPRGDGMTGGESRQLVKMIGKGTAESIGEGVFGVQKAGKTDWEQEGRKDRVPEVW